jgi:hypothetical protein
LFANSIADAQNLHFLGAYSAIDDFAMIAIVEGRRWSSSPMLRCRTVRSPIFSPTPRSKSQLRHLWPATSPAMALAQLNALAKTEIAGVPYRGSGEAARQRVGRRHPGRLRVLCAASPRRRQQGARVAIASPQRIAPPEVPTACRSWDPNFDYSGFLPSPRPQRRRRRSSPFSISTSTSGAVEGVQEPHGGARHDGAGPEHAGGPRRLHAARDRAPGALAALTGIKMDAAPR